MKRLFLIFAVLFASCFEVQVKPREVNAQGFNANMIDYGFRIEVIDGMKYGIWYVDGRSSQTGYDIEIINLTKDSLEVELLKKQLFGLF
jgi:hypothetical protein